MPFFHQEKWALREQDPRQEPDENAGDTDAFRNGTDSRDAVALQTGTELSETVVDSLVRFPELLALVEAWPGMTERERNSVLRLAGNKPAR